MGEADFAARSSLSIDPEPAGLVSTFEDSSDEEEDESLSTTVSAGMGSLTKIKKGFRSLGRSTKPSITHLGEALSTPRGRVNNSSPSIHRAVHSLGRKDSSASVTAPQRLPGSVNYVSEPKVGGQHTDFGPIVHSTPVSHGVSEVPATIPQLRRQQKNSLQDVQVTPPFDSIRTKKPWRSGQFGNSPPGQQTLHRLKTFAQIRLDLHGANDPISPSPAPLGKGKDASQTRQDVGLETIDTKSLQEQLLEHPGPQGYQEHPFSTDGPTRLVKEMTERPNTSIGTVSEEPPGEQLQHTPPIRPSTSLDFGHPLQQQDESCASSLFLRELSLSSNKRVEPVPSGTQTDTLYSATSSEPETEKRSGPSYKRPSAPITDRNQILGKQSRASQMLANLLATLVTESQGAQVAESSKGAELHGSHLAACNAKPSPLQLEDVTITMEPALQTSLAGNDTDPVEPAWEASCTPHSRRWGQTEMEKDRVRCHSLDSDPPDSDPPFQPVRIRPLSFDDQKKYTKISQLQEDTRTRPSSLNTQHRSFGGRPILEEIEESLNSLPPPRRLPPPRPPPPPPLLLEAPESGCSGQELSCIAEYMPTPAHTEDHAVPPIGKPVMTSLAEEPHPLPAPKLALDGIAEDTDATDLPLSTPSVNERRSPKQDEAEPWTVVEYGTRTSNTIRVSVKHHTFFADIEALCGKPEAPKPGRFSEFIRQHARGSQRKPPPSLPLAPLSSQMIPSVTPKASDSSASPFNRATLGCGDTASANAVGLTADVFLPAPKSAARSLNRSSTGATGDEFTSPRNDFGLTDRARPMSSSFAEGTITTPSIQRSVMGFLGDNLFGLDFELPPLGLAEDHAIGTEHSQDLTTLSASPRPHPLDEQRVSETAPGEGLHPFQQVQNSYLDMMDDEDEMRLSFASRHPAESPQIQKNFDRRESESSEGRSTSRDKSAERPTDPEYALHVQLFGRDPEVYEPLFFILATGRLPPTLSREHHHSEQHPDLDAIASPNRSLYLAAQAEAVFLGYPRNLISDAIQDQEDDVC